MATLWQRLTGQQTRSAAVSIPSREATFVTPDAALTLTAVYRAIQVIATPVSKMPIKTFRYGGGTEQQIPNPLLVNKPSLLDTPRDFKFQTVVSLAQHGEAFWLKRFDRAGNVNSVDILPADSVGVRLTNSGSKVYDYKGITYTEADVEHLKLFSRPGELRGYGPLHACRQDLAGVMDLREYATNWFGNSGIPTGIIKTPLFLSEEDSDEITRRFVEKQQKRQPAVMGNSFEYDPVGINPRDAMFIEAQSQAVQLVARLMGIPPRLLITGVDGTSDTYSNLQDENQVFWRHTIMAYTDPIADAMSNLLPRGTRVEFDFEGLFRADLAQRYENYKLAIEGGWLTIDEVRQKEGLA